MNYDFLNDVDGFDFYVVVSNPQKYKLRIEELSKILKQNGYINQSIECLTFRRTEEYVRYWGKEIKLGKYQVFNPATGTHDKYDTLDEAKAALIEVCNEVLRSHSPAIVREISNELGDTAWTPVSLENKVTVTIKE